MVVITSAWVKALFHDPAVRKQLGFSTWQHDYTLMADQVRAKTWSHICMSGALQTAGRYAYPIRASWRQVFLHASGIIQRLLTVSAMKDT